MNDKGSILSRHGLPRLLTDKRPPVAPNTGTLKNREKNMTHKTTTTLCNACIDNLTSHDEATEHYAHYLLESTGQVLDLKTAKPLYPQPEYAECDSCSWWGDEGRDTELHTVDMEPLAINGTKHDPVHLCHSCNLYAHHGSHALDVIADWIDVDPEYLDDALEEYTDVFTENTTGLLPSPHTPLDDAAGTMECHTCKTTKYGFRYLWMIPRT